MTDWNARQNRDGGWGYGRGDGKGSSWTEPTAFVLLAQSATQVDTRSFETGLAFLRSMQRSEGGWSPQPQVAESTWVTAVAALLPDAALGVERLNRAVDWLEGQTGRESGWSYRLRQRIAGNRETYPEGWPWFPGAAAWVIPTSLGILAFERALKRRDASGLQARIRTGREFLMARVCADGGWNHGSNRALGRDGDSYPETTGIALLALRGVKSPVIEKAKAAARTHLSTCRTAEGIAWLRMGLAAHGEQTQSQFTPVPRTIVDEALLALASSSRNPLLAI